MTKELTDTIVSKIKDVIKLRQDEKLVLMSKIVNKDNDLELKRLKASNQSKKTDNDLRISILSLILKLITKTELSESDITFLLTRLCSDPNYSVKTVESFESHVGETLSELVARYNFKYGKNDLVKKLSKLNLKLDSMNVVQSSL
jgi:hypothetical protein